MARRRVGPDNPRMDNKQGSFRQLLVILALALQAIIILALGLAWPDAASQCRPRASQPDQDRPPLMIPWGGGS